MAVASPIYLLWETVDWGTRFQSQKVVGYKRTQSSSEAWVKRHSGGCSGKFFWSKAGYVNGLEREPR